MKEIIINSKAHGRKVVLVDDEDYDELIKFRWYVSKGKAGNFYVRRCVGQKKIKMHRHVLGLTNPEIKGDHIDGDGLNNQRDNLRSATHLQNNFNRKPLANASSKYLGVHWHDITKKWKAEISVGNRNIYLGVYKTQYQAAFAYNYAAKSLRGEFANLNEIIT